MPRGREWNPEPRRWQDQRHRRPWSPKPQLWVGHITSTVTWADIVPRYLGNGTICVAHVWYLYLGFFGYTGTIGGVLRLYNHNTAASHPLAKIQILGGTEDGRPKHIWGPIYLQKDWGIQGVGYLGTPPNPPHGTDTRCGAVGWEF